MRLLRNLLRPKTDNQVAALQFLKSKTKQKLLDIPELTALSAEPQNISVERKTARK